MRTTGRYAVPGSSASGPAYQQFLGSFIEGTTPLDPSTLTKAGTGYNPATGVITFVTSNTVTQVDGYTEACPRFSVKVTDIHPTFNYATDMLDIYQEITAFPAGGATAGIWGLAVGVMDAPGSSYATCNGVARGISQHSAAGVRLHGMQATNVASGVTNVAGGVANLATRTIYMQAPAPTGTQKLAYVDMNMYSSDWGSLGTSAGITAGNPSPALANNGGAIPYIHVMAYHASGTAEVDLTLSMRLWTRILKIPTFGLV